jgi:hypothetical protein
VKAVSIKLTDLTLDVLLHKLYNIFNMIMSMYIIVGNIMIDYVDMMYFMCLKKLNF